MKPVQILIPADDLDCLNGLLKQTKWVQGASDRDQIIHVVSVAFSESPDWEADIQVVNSASGPYVDPVLFHDGVEVCALDVRDQLDGDYVFAAADKTFAVAVRCDATR